MLLTDSTIRTFVGCAALMTVNAPQTSLSATDSEISEAVKQEFADDFRLRDLEVEVRCSGGRVTLSGSAASLFDRLRAGRLCRRIEGVRAVTNRIEVRPLPRSDEEIAQAVTRRWKADRLLRLQKLRARVEGRVVTIEGTVSSPIQRVRAQRLARKVSGVLIVRNESEVAMPSQSPASESPAEPASEPATEPTRSAQALSAAVVETVVHDTWLLMPPTQIALRPSCLAINQSSYLVDALSGRDQESRRRAERSKTTRN